jgi:anti-anti-sigma factor
MGKLAEGSGYPTEVDLPCGYTPRAIEFSRKGKRFVGLDLPAAIADAEPAIRSLIDEDKQDLVRFEGVDATNYQSLKAVFDEIDGEVCITTEGLFMYFTDSEMGMLCDNVRRILNDHGGCWITCDPEISVQYVLVTKAFYGDRFIEVMKSARNQVNEKADVKVGNNSLTIHPLGDPAKDMQKAMAFLADHGLKAERLILSEYAPEIQSYSKATPEQVKEIKNVMKNVAYWKITVNDEFEKPLDTSETNTENFNAKASLSGEKLSIQLFGRLDTLTAPHLLAFFEKTSEKNTISEVEVDCGPLDYISSAGLRILLIMQKRCGKGVTLKRINDTVKEILEQTGFDSILNVEE